MLTLILDIGTTAIKGLLINKAARKDISSDFILNDQIKSGEDVITRIEFALKGRKNQKLLKLAVTNSINKLIKKLLAKTKFKPADITETVIVSNTAMHHLFLGISCEPLVKPPYRASVTSQLVLSARKSGLHINKQARIKILPNIGGFVGSDALGFIIASGIYKSNSVKLGIDIGTNGEIILGSSNKILAASTAAGAAFEAIKGLSGSEIIDIIAKMLQKGIIDKTGRLKKHSPRIKQADIRKIQLAKAAIRAGIKILAGHLGIEESKISKITVTGAFGNSINARNAISIGLIPKVPANRIKFIKNGAIEGAKQYILSKKIQRNMASIISKVKRIPLARKDFQDTYINSMGFYND